MVSYLFEHFADLAITSFDDRYFEPGIVAFANQFYLRGSGANSASTFFGDRDATAQFVELRFVGNARDFHYVLLGHVRRGFHQRFASAPSLVRSNRPSLAQSSLPTGYTRPLTLFTRSMTVGRCSGSLTVVT